MSTDSNIFGKVPKFSNEADEAAWWADRAPALNRSMRPGAELEFLTESGEVRYAKCGFTIGGRALVLVYRVTAEARVRVITAWDHPYSSGREGKD